MRCRIIFLLLLSGATFARAEQPAVPSRDDNLTLPQLRQLLVRDLHEAEAKRLFAAGKQAEAVEAAEKVVVIERAVHGPAYPGLLQSQGTLLQAYVARKDFKAAIAAARAADDLAGKLKEVAPTVRIALRQARVLLERFEALTAEQQQEVLRAGLSEAEMQALLKAGKQAEAREALRQARQQYLPLVREDPLLHAAMLMVRGRCCSELGDHDDAVAAAVEAWQLARKHLSADLRELPEMQQSLDNVLRQARDSYIARAEWQKARAVTAHWRSLLQAQHGQDNPEVGEADAYLRVVDSLEKLTPAQFQQLPEAIKLRTEAQGQQLRAQKLTLLEQAGSSFAKLLGPEHIFAASCHYDMATMLAADGQPQQALVLARACVTPFQQAYGPHHSRALNAHRSLVDALEQLACEQGAPAEIAAAQTAWLQHRELQLKAHGPRHWAVQEAETHAAIMKEIAQLPAEQQQVFRKARQLNREMTRLDTQHKHQEALMVGQQAVEQEKKLLLGAASPIRRMHANTLTNLAAQLRSVGRQSEASVLYQEAIRQFQAVGWERMPAMGYTCQGLGICFRLQSQNTEAEKYLRQALAIFEQSEGKTSQNYGDTANSLGVVYQQTGRLVQAAEHYQQARTSLSAAVGTAHQMYDTATNNLGIVSRVLGNLAEAETCFRELRDLRAQTQGTNSVRYAESLNSLGYVYLLTGRDAEADPLFEQAMALLEKLAPPAYNSTYVYHNLAALASRKGDMARTREFCERYLTRGRQLAGPKQAELIGYLRHIGTLALLQQSFDLVQRVSMEQAALCEGYLQQALTLSRQVHGADHVMTATVLGNLGQLALTREAFERAAPLLQEALAIRLAKLGPNHLETAQTHNTLAVLYVQQGDLLRSAQHRSLALEGFSRSVGLKHPATLNCRIGFGRYCSNVGDQEKAEATLRETLRLIEENIGKERTLYVLGLQALGTTYANVDDLEQAELFLQKAIQISRRLPDSTHWTQQSLIALVKLYLRGDRYEEAAPLLQDLVQSVPPETAAHVDVLLLQIQLLAHRGEPAQAETLARQAVELARKHLGEASVPHSAALAVLAQVLETRGDKAEAATLLRRSLDLDFRQVRLTAHVQSERQQLAMALTWRRRLDDYLSLGQRTAVAPADLHSAVLTWKGSVFARQQQLRLARTATDADTKQLLEKLQTLAARLGALALNTPQANERAAWKKELQELTDEKERLERDLSARSPAFRQQQEQAQISAAQLLRALPDGTVLLDFLEYTQRPQLAKGVTSAQEQRRLLVFVLRPGRAVALLDLGEMAKIEDAVEQWRRTLAPRVSPPHRAAGQELRRLLWEPLREQVAGAQRVLLAPDGALGRLPFGALPGDKPGSYLLEEVALAVLPGPQLLPELLARPARTAEPLSLLLVGDVDFAAGQGKAADAVSLLAPRAGLAGSWNPLPGTSAEVKAIEAAFARRFPMSKARLLAGDGATEAELRRQTAQHRWLHLATHGFFMPQRTAGSRLDRLGSSEIVGFHPGLLSGLVLAGANQPAVAGQDDGILTALEIAELDLSQVEMAVLSACETGLGKAASGEGLLGLQRAFQVAGARTVVASLWSVPDEPTRILMERVYQNLWRVQQPLDKLEALREAQLWMLHNGRQHAGIVRGVERLNAGERPDPNAPLPAYYWAAFVLSGDWR